MRFYNSRLIRFATFLTAAFVVTGCGVKSAPTEPEGATYPRIYPAAPTGNTSAKPVVKPTLPSATPGAYQPPPPATQLPK